MKKISSGPFLKLSTKEILSSVKDRPLEDLKSIFLIEDFLKQKRRYVFKMPPINTPVILLLSGGLDTIITWGILLKEYKLKVYPLYLRRGQIRTFCEEDSIDYFYHFYQKQFPNNIVKPFKINAFIPPYEIRWPLTQSGMKVTQENPRQGRGLPMFSSLLFDYAVQYAYFLEQEKNISTRTIFCGFMPSDSNLFRYETLTALRSINLNICTLTNDYSWQVTSPALEKEIGHFYYKDAFIRWAHENHLPLEKSYSCFELGLVHCGYCASCFVRRKFFNLSKIKDPTIYYNNLKLNIFQKIIYRLKLSIYVLTRIVSILDISVNIIKAYLTYLLFKKAS